MNEQERYLISYLRKDAKTSLSSLSKQISMPISTIYDKINRLHRNLVITKYTALVDFVKMGYNHHAHLVLKVNKTQRKELQLFLQKHQAVNSLHEINGGFDFWVETLHKDIKEYTAFLEGLKDNFQILALHEYQVIGEVEREKVN